MPRTVRRTAAAPSFRTPSGVALVAANLVPLVGVFAWGWDAYQVVLLYWIENVIVGAVNVLKILLASGTDASTPDPGRATGGRATADEEGKAFLVLFFTVHYGLFTLVHGVFLFVLLGSPDGFPSAHGHPLAGIHRAVSGVGGWAILALLASHLVSFVVHYLLEGERRLTTAKEQFSAPYGRIVVLHLAILFGGIGVQALGNPTPLLGLLVLGKTALDLRFHRRERAKAAGAPAA